jgi:4-hydroxy-tetrahydrodipicolinate synthase
MSAQIFKGSIVALVTPFQKGEVDLKAVADLVEWHISEGTQALCPAGTTGESPTLTHDERFRLFRQVVQSSQGRVPVLAGTGTNDTRTSIELTRMAGEAGADGALVVTPYYNKPPQEGLFRHFEAVANAASIPLVLYNVPGRTSVNLVPETVARLAKIAKIVAIKEASGNLEQVTQIRALCDLAILSGDDTLTLPIMALGGVGVISVAGNISPREVAQFCRACESGDFGRARELHVKWSKLFRALFWETNPIPVKTAMKWMGRTTGELRLPLCEMSSESQGRLKVVLQECGLLRSS